MRNPFPRFLSAALGCCVLLAVPAISFAASCPCGQPATCGTSAAPKPTDALAILKAAVGGASPCITQPCVCDLNGDGKISVADALIALRKAVGQIVPVFQCNCPDYGPPCTSARFESRAGGILDSGWTGIAHDSELVEGASIDVRILRRCSDSSAPCEKNAECASGICKPTCDCNADKDCEITGPTHQKKCTTTLANCRTNADCPIGVACVAPFGPPLPLSSGGTPVCVQSLFDGPVTGTAGAGTGSGVVSLRLKSRVFLGIALDEPCPRCGLPAPDLEVGDMHTCEGGQFPGAACRVDGISTSFGGTSFDCPPELNANISGSGLAVRLSEVTTGTTTKTAVLPCTDFTFRSNPKNAPDNPGKCLDNNAACTTNTDCRRCSGDSTIACTSDANCSGHGSCAEAPDQPVSCGYWCSCGFCDGNASLPCFGDGDCPDGQQCTVGPGTGTAQNAPQKKPNDCSTDKFLCGQDAPEQCASTQVGKCSTQPYRSCNDDSTCINNDAGLCVFEPRPCFGPRITRTGHPSPLGRYCSVGQGDACTSNADCRRCSGEHDRSCTTNADCSGVGGCGPTPCADDSAAPATVALFCLPGTSNPSINSVGGITGPGAVRLSGFVQVCRCGDGRIGCDEQCDDGNTANGDGCDDFCQFE